MLEEKPFITINHLDFYGGHTKFRVGDTLELRKDEDNPYDDEAIAAYLHGSKCGFVANSVYSVARGTYSAGHIYSCIQDKSTCQIWFITEDLIIAKML